MASIFFWLGRVGSVSAFSLYEMSIFLVYSLCYNVGCQLKQNINQLTCLLRGDVSPSSFPFFVRNVYGEDNFSGEKQ
jgi:hypothetical protein